MRIEGKEIEWRARLELRIPYATDYWSSAELRDLPSLPVGVEKISICTDFFSISTFLYHQMAMKSNEEMATLTRFGRLSVVHMNYLAVQIVIAECSTP